MNAILKHKKEEKRLVKLLYKKGFLNDYKIDKLFWESFSILRVKKRKHGRKYKQTVYLPEIHFCVTDYWGETDAYSIVSAVFPSLEYTLNEEFEYIITNRYSRIQRIKMLKKLPTVINNNKIKKVLTIKND